jgi:hypothetical protein
MQMQVFEIHKSLGLFWVREYDFHDMDGEKEIITHGPFMDARDAWIECDKPENWRVMFN